ncbi:MAG: hypothetical protein A2Z24_00990 [Candidatus Woykebacteria bacterium RBG_16_44_10]|uniref:Secondary thiamine-phosphate synthase enzyme n=1 Tax=Candidatus Woykebacteria bacterium RBG_16_44_10 TaxID=1802597 RepID=A0A1G1WEJ1_9BACT|nr:MAG: hypothetical protein A2Z24_00990 [Candidatus Woykebacteria bacterium RBG_16_44_10]
MNKQLEFQTTKKRELIDITSAIQDAVAQSNTKEGICLIFVPHATAAVLINEDEPGFKTDIERLISIWIPEGDWEHDRVDDNATSHLASALIGQSRSIPVKDSRLQLGTWQQIFLVELDGPRSSRRVIISVV